MNEAEITKLMKNLGYDKITQIITLRKEGHKIKHKTIMFDNKRMPVRSIISLKAVKDIIKCVQSKESEVEPK